MKKIILVLIFFVLSSVSIAENNSYTNTINMCNQEEIIERINMNTNIVVKDAIDKYLDAKIDNIYIQKKQDIINEFNIRWKAISFFLKVVVISIFGAFFLALIGYAYINRLLNKKL